ncbi:diacylglycerol/lipid kinase family protein [Rhodopirellula sp. MGV]|uniref:diacylglycerol/lipid kinase family protein n=1 Tax=Rhodopirellula sp. MGV TaxID=2023130 RepID=UPI00130411FA|nr:diacylglycerol kinase family protein [Rhodopirellula sp. MGV]
MDLLSRPILLFTSPKAGSGANREQIPLLRQLLSERGLKFHEVGCPDELARISRHAADVGAPQPVVIAAGGDGTLGLVASRTLPETPLLPMPMGTENLVGKMVGQASTAEAVFASLAGGKIRRIDAATANGRLFLIMATAGFDAEVVRRLHLRRKGHIRRSSYVAPILQTLQRYRFPKIRISRLADDDTVIDETVCRWAMVFNLPRYAAGLQIAPTAIDDDGQLDVVAMSGRGLISGLRYVAGALSGSLERHQDIERFQTHRIRIESDERVAFELDGDYIGRLPMVIESLPLRVTLVVP